MAQIDANATHEQIAQMEREYALKRAAAERRRAAELARLSELRQVTDGNGTIWAYVVVDASFVRIISCLTGEQDLAIPDTLESLPVREIGTEALSALDAPRRIACCDGIESIGSYAFRSCGNLEHLVLPANTASFSSSWVAKCPNLVELVLPGTLEEVPAEALANPAVKSLVLGKGTKSVAYGAFEKARLDEVRIDPANPYLATDGTCIYTTDGTELVAMARKVPRYEVSHGCLAIGRKAFAGARELHEVVLPYGLASIADYAFTQSGIEALACPASLVSIGARAFLRCQSLRRADLNEGLREIGPEAFAGTALEALVVPASVRSLGRSVSERSNVRHAGPDATFAIEAGNPAYYVDGCGCLYRRAPDGVHLMQLLEPETASYEVEKGTVGIDEKAFAYHARIQSVSLPEGLKDIGAGAFRVCRKLVSVSMPSTIEHVGEDAFIDTALAQFSIPEALVDIGRNALVTDGAHHEGTPPALRSIAVDAANPRFFMHAGMLCRRTETGTNIVMFTNSCDRVDFPEDVEEIEDYAFNNAFGIRELSIGARLKTVGACALSVDSQIRLVRIDVAEPIEGRTSFVLNFPAASRSVHGFLLALGSYGELYLPDIMAQYDSCIAGARDYRAPGSSDNASAYEQVRLIIGRLDDAVLLTKANRKRYRTLISENIEEICVDIARHDDRATIGRLADLGFVNADNLERITLAVGKLQDAAMTGYLLEMKRVRFAGSAFDFDL